MEKKLKLKKVCFSFIVIQNPISTHLKFIQFSFCCVFIQFIAIHQSDTVESIYELKTFYFAILCLCWFVDFNCALSGNAFLSLSLSFSFHSLHTDRKKYHSQSNNLKNEFRLILYIYWLKLRMIYYLPNTRCLCVHV